MATTTTTTTTTTSTALPPDASPSTPTPSPGLEEARRSGHLQGNFHSYYSFHPPLPRVDALLGKEEEEEEGKATPAHAEALRHILPTRQQDNQEAMLVADWGCNQGELTVALCKRLRQHLARRGKEDDATRRCVVALGLELDSTLVDKARAMYKEKEEDVTFHAVDLVKERDKCAGLMDAFVRAHGGTSSSSSSPIRKKVDLLTIFSTTMWIHVAHGDAALKAFLLYAASWARCLVVEPQDTRSYKTARKRLRRVGLDPAQHFQPADPTLCSSEALSAFLLGKGGFAGVLNLGKSSSWGRDLLLFWREEGEEEESDRDTKRPKTTL